MKASILIAILLVCTPVAVVADDEQPSADAPAVDASAAELEAARQQVNLEQMNSYWLLVQATGVRSV